MHTRRALTRWQVVLCRNDPKLQRGSGQSHTRGAVVGMGMQWVWEWERNCLVSRLPEMREAEGKPEEGGSNAITSSLLPKAAAW